MKRHDIVNSMAQSWDFLSELELAASYANPDVLEVNEEFRNLALSVNTNYISLYLFGLRNSHYNFSLIDFSYFQFSWEREDVVRYVFYPNPFVKNFSSVEIFNKYNELVEAGFIDIEEYYTLLNDTNPEIKVPPIRYENAPSQHNKLRHPCSHFHIGHHTENRWAIRRILTPLAFTLFIVKQYYSTRWNKHDLLDGTHFASNKFHDMLINEKKKCKEVSDEFFTKIEEQSFYFS